MYKMIGFLVLAALVLAGCAPSRLELTETMKIDMLTYASQYEVNYPAEAALVNTARVCAQSPLGVYYNSKLDWYIVTCSIPSQPTVYGMVFMELGAVSSTTTLNANSDQALENILQDLGYE